MSQVVVPNRDDDGLNLVAAEGLGSLLPEPLDTRVLIVLGLLFLRNFLRGAMLGLVPLGAALILALLMDYTGGPRGSLINLLEVPG